MTPLGTLLEMLTYRRPADSDTERDFISRFIIPLGATADENGPNWHITIPQIDGSPSPVVWSAHTDTVHRAPGRQRIAFDGRIASLSRHAHKHGSNCLGADDTAGVWILCEMIKRRIPGHYIFHYAEECGGIGSGALAEYDPHLLDGATMAIAFDRRNTGDVITHQYHGRTCSDRFALSLAHELNRVDPTFKYAPAHGIYTDTAEYAGIVRECTNLSVGYQSEHRSDEMLDTRHTLALLEAICKIDIGALVIDRTPGHVSPVNTILWGDTVSDDYNYSYCADNDLDKILGQYDPADLCTCGHAAIHHDTKSTECTHCMCDGFEPLDQHDYYLDREYADVQLALAKAQAELTLQTSHLTVCMACGAKWIGNYKHTCAVQKDQSNAV